MTIYAQSSAPGRAGVAVFRVSGPRAGEAVERLSGRGLPRPRRAALRTVVDPKTGTPIDRGLVLWFPGPDSFTGEDVGEFHIHGGPAVTAALVDALAQIDGLRLAEPGEFTRRAFEHGKMDLTAAEGIADLIGAETEAQRLQAFRQMDGALSSLYDGWRSTLILALAKTEADLDFPDEDLPDSLIDQVRPEISALADEIAAHLRDDRRGERLRDGFQIVLTGLPNVGKSSLINRLAKRDVAIVSDIAGTTRDVIEVRLDLAGYLVMVADTAGLRDGGDRVEQEGVRRARARAEAADLTLHLVDADSWNDEKQGLLRGRNDSEIIVVNKIDVAAVEPVAGAMAVSAKTGAGIEDLLRLLEERVIAAMGLRESPSLTQARHREALVEAVKELGEFLHGDPPDPELKAENLRLAARALGRITGRVDVEDVLDVVFRDFCIGK